MKNLLYKDFKLVITPLVWLLILGFPLLCLIPQYPKAVSFIYIMSVYPLIFLGASKGTINNDIYYSLIQPVSRKNIVGSRLLTVGIIEFALLIVSCIMIPIGYQLELLTLPEEGMDIVNVGLGFHGMFALMAFTLVAFAVMDLIFFPMFYKTGKNFAVPFIVSMIAFAIFLIVPTMILPPLCEPFNNVFGVWDPLVQSLTLIAGLLIYFILRLITYIITNKVFEKADI